MGGSARGLCYLCYGSPQIRAAYPRLRDLKRAEKGRRPPQEDPYTAEQVEALVAEGMANLPLWWKREEEQCERAIALRVAEREPRVVRMGKGLRCERDYR